MNEEIIDIRAHHLYTLSQIFGLKIYKSAFALKIYRKFKQIQFKFMGRKEYEQFVNLLIDKIVKIIKNKSAMVRIVTSYDSICKECPQRNSGQCIAFRKKYSPEFLSNVDKRIIANSNGILKADEVYSSEYVLNNISKIRRAIRKTLLEIHKLKTF